ncbi:MAG: hypothetical protein ABIP54_02700, partial [Candidatus Andersenbacteria bacterium]
MIIGGIVAIATFFFLPAIALIAIFQRFFRSPLHFSEYLAITSALVVVGVPIISLAVIRIAPFQYIPWLAYALLLSAIVLLYFFRPVILPL